MGYKRESHNGQPLLLSSEDKGNDFSIVCDNCHNITLSKWGKLVAWFSVVVTEETLRGFLELVKDSEKSKWSI